MSKSGRRCVGLGAFAALLIAGAAAITRAETETQPASTRPEQVRLLRIIGDEVREMGPCPGDRFIKREFFVGEDDDDTYKDIHVAIVIQPDETGERVAMLVTYLKRDPRIRTVSYSTHSKNLTYLLREDRAEIETSDYSSEEREDLLPEILRAVRDKKKLLRDNLRSARR